jgi:hypothetical protein
MIINLQYVPSIDPCSVLGREKNDLKRKTTRAAGTAPSSTAAHWWSRTASEDVAMLVTLYLTTFCVQVVRHVINLFLPPSRDYGRVGAQGRLPENSMERKILAA